MDELGVLTVERSTMRVLTALGLARDPAIRRGIESALAENPLPQQASGNLFQIDVKGDGGERDRAVGLAVCDEALVLVLVRKSTHAPALFDLVGVVPFAYSILELLLNNSHSAITVADDKGRICYLSPVHEKFLDLKFGESHGKKAEAVIPNSRLGAVARSGKPEYGQLQSINGVTRVVNRIPVTENGQVVGAIGQMIFKGPDSLQRMNQRVEQLRAEVELYKKELLQLRAEGAHGALIGGSVPMQRLRREIETVARLDVPVLIVGESGTGKELVAQAIHLASGRATEASLVSLNLAALPTSLIESELFGYAPGSYTGARRDGQRGKFEQAEGGTLFLDEIADVPMEMQVKLLRVLEDHQVERLGSRSSRRIEFRVVSATNRDLSSLIDEGLFRLDLYYRLSGVILHLPALSERLEDIPLLLTHFVQGFCRRNERPVPAVDADVSNYLASQPWPGNVRQLRHRIEEALVFCDGNSLKVKNFLRNERLPFNRRLMTSGASVRTQSSDDKASPSAGTLKEAGRQAVLNEIARCGGNKKEAAERLGISRSYLYKILALSNAKQKDRA